MRYYHQLLLLLLCLFFFFHFQAHELANMTGHDDRVLSVASDAQGKLCTSSLDKSVRLWAPHLSTETAETGHNGSVTFVQCIENGDGLITGSRLEAGGQFLIT